jgi:hypothetical protein
MTEREYERVRERERANHEYLKLHNLGAKFTFILIKTWRNRPGAPFSAAREGIYDGGENRVLIQITAVVVMIPCCPDNERGCACSFRCYLEGFLLQGFGTIHKSHQFP